jgi:hypothetical protein
MICENCQFLDAHGVDITTIGCLVCGGGVLDEMSDADDLRRYDEINTDEYVDWINEGCP